MQHLSEEQLILYHYGEIEDRPQVEDHLAACPSCHTSYQALREVLAAVEAAPVPELEEDYGAAVWQKLRPALGPLAASREPVGGNLVAQTLVSAASRLVSTRGPAPRQECRGGTQECVRHKFDLPAKHSTRPGLWLFPRWAMAGAMALLLVGAFLAGRFSTRPTAPIPEKVRERILLVAVGDHLERSQMVLAELIHAPGNGSVDISAEQQWAEDLLDSNRLFRQTADGAGEKALASVLEDLERTLLEIAHSPSELSAQKLEELRSRIESEGILFKVRILGSELRERQGRDRL